MPNTVCSKYYNLFRFNINSKKKNFFRVSSFSTAKRPNTEIMNQIKYLLFNF